MSPSALDAISKSYLCGLKQTPLLFSMNPTLLYFLMVLLFKESNS